VENTDTTLTINEGSLSVNAIHTYQIERRHILKVHLITGHESPER